MSIEQMRSRYEEIKKTWHSASGRERDEDVRALTDLITAAEASTEDGAEALQMEVEDLIDDIQRHSTHT